MKHELWEERGKPQELRDLVSYSRRYGGIELLQPPGRDILNAVESPCQLSGQRAGRVRISPPVHHANQTIFKTSGVEKAVKDRLNGIYNITAGAAGPGLEAESRMLGDQTVGELVAIRASAIEQHPARHARNGHHCGVRFGVVVSNVPLLDAPLAHQLIALQ